MWAPAELLAAARRAARAQALSAPGASWRRVGASKVRSGGAHASCRGLSICTGRDWLATAIKTLGTPSKQGGHVVTVPAESAGAYKLYKLGARVTLPQLAISSGAGTCTLPREQALAPLSAYRHLWEPIAEAIRCHPQ